MKSSGSKYRCIHKGGRINFFVLQDIHPRIWRKIPDSRIRIIFFIILKKRFFSFFLEKKTGPPQAENFDAFCHQRRRKTVFFRFGETEKSPSPMRLRVRFLSKLTECKTKNSISPPEFIFVFLNFRKNLEHL